MKQAWIAPVSLAAAVSTAGFGLFAWFLVRGIHPTSLDDQPVILSGGSLHMRSDKDWKRTAQTMQYTHTSTYPLADVLFACNVEDEPQRYEFSQSAASIAIDYDGRHTLNISINAAGTVMTGAITKRNGQPASRGVHDTFFELGHHPRADWKADSIRSTGLATNFDCQSSPSGRFYMKLRFCNGSCVQ